MTSISTVREMEERRSRPTVVYEIELAATYIHTYKMTTLWSSILMNGSVKSLIFVLVYSAVTIAADIPVIEITRAAQDSVLDTNPASQFWRAARPVYMETDAHGNRVPEYRTEVRTRWTDKNLYFLFVCPYQQLNLKPGPQTLKETNQLWNWDVAEVFVGSDFKDIKRYKEFEISPQGEWIDLDIDLHNPHHEGGWTWNSGFEVAARIDRNAHVWYGAMRIPYSEIDHHRPPAPGNLLRVNLFRSQGPSPQTQVTWQAPMSDSFHMPERFGLLRLVK